MTATTLTEPTYSPPQAARRLGVTYTAVHRWVRTWLPAIGSGHRYRITHTDLMVMRAWQVLDTTGHRGGHRPSAPWLRATAETAIRAEPNRWLLIGRTSARTYDHAETAAAAWAEATEPVWLIDLQPWLCPTCSAPACRRSHP